MMVHVSLARTGTIDLDYSTVHVDYIHVKYFAAYAYIQPRRPQVGTVTYKTADRNMPRGCELHASPARVHAPEFGGASERA